MKTVRGHFDGSIIVLDEPAPVAHAVAVEITFPDVEPQQQPAMEVPSRFSWDKTSAINDGYTGSVSDEVVRQRRMD